MSSLQAHPLDQGSPPLWASEWGEDRYGVFVAFTLGQAKQRMRWIPPGTFWMGSPEEEPGRDEDETRHRVTLTRGYWLADTPCTQALWEEVTGENPSRFPSAERPVEQVSWKDVQEFLSELANRVPGLAPRLPTEAEWEYACRAGTETATYAGAMEILGENNAPVLDAIAWYGGNSGVGFDLEEGEDSSKWREKQHDHRKAGTRIVARKEPNPWGLYDVLGNVWEWCEDWYGPYEPTESTNPMGPDLGTYRVCRGGSWNSNARDVRAAYRSHLDPSYRWIFRGFRLARGQE